MALKRYHVNPQTGKPGLCVAQQRCRFGGPSKHYPSSHDARWAYERHMMREQGEGQQLAPALASPLSDNVVSGNQFVIEPGVYFFGDPYTPVASRDQQGWNSIVESIENQFGWENDREPERETQAAVGACYRDKNILMLKSWQGAGLHWSLGPTRRLPSDTGLLGFIDEQTLAQLHTSVEQAEAMHLGMRVELAETTTVWRDEQGVIIVGGKLIICHNDILESKWFASLASADGINNRVPTAETYEFILKTAQAWRANPTSTAG